MEHQQEQNGSTYPLHTVSPCITADNLDPDLANPFLDGTYYSVRVKAHNCLLGTGSTSLSTSYASYAGTLPSLIPDEPTIDYNINGCVYEFCVDPVYGALTYSWYHGTSCSYLNNVILNTTDLCPSVQYPNSYCIEVIAENGCGNSSEAHIEGSVPGNLTCRLETNETDSLPFNKKQLSVYPSPSSGFLWIENNAESKIVVVLKTVSGVIVSKVVLQSGEKRELTNLNEGLLIIEAFRENDRAFIKRQLIPVIIN